jgi:endonuclease/exonuclease/phosphatase (EEP) superfamily protein YafD
MLIRFRSFTWLFAMPLLVSCAGIDTMRIVSNSHAANNEKQSCEIPVKDEQIVSAHGLDPEKITFLTWNIYKGDGEGWQKDLAAFARSHDLMVIQEATLDPELTGLLESNDLNWIMNSAFQMNGTTAGVMNVANLNAVYSCGLKVREPIIRLPKSTLVSYYEIEGSDEKLLVANIHGINFTLGISVYHEQLEQLYDAVKEHHGPMIVAGDFNSWNDDRMREVNHLVERLSLSRIEYPINNKTHVFGKAIDHVFYRQLELVNNRVWQVSSSDHNPVSVNFRVQPKAEYSTVLSERF